ncbi:DUF742 domain-containing protein [Streptomyces sp. CMB-StM0423]|uniref:DUF742 domain-containing protein n=1 Tax=unclassified Streptomyces TaxID=2593676 RepID=UPI000C701D56|nr:DUF742 domain-containing protein [Streptomyces sp. CMB-StM0423]AUH39310.1 hypothetical protein CXR04_02730 [Streptomyces sp. CMB-StM0423]
MSAPRGTRRTRTFALTGSRTDRAPGEQFTMHSTVRAAVPPDDARSIPEEWQTILRLCAGPGIAVAELAARIGMRLTPAAVLLAQLLEQGLIEHRPPMSDPDAMNIDFLRRIRSGLERA